MPLSLDYIALSTDVRPSGIKRITNVEMETDPMMQKFADKRKTVLLAFVGSYVPRRYGPLQFAGSTMSIRDEFSIEEALTQISKSCERKGRKLYLLVNSPGGALSSAFKISMAIRRSFDDITVFVPHMAASGGVMLALTGNRIRMGIMSQLSPVDVQVWYKDSYVSANSMLAAKTNLDKHLSMKSIDELPYTERHLVESLDPVILEEFTRSVLLGKTYLETILKEVGYDEAKRMGIIQKLIFDLPAHEFVIHADLAKQMDIVVEDSKTDAEEWDMMRNWFARYIDEAEDRHFVRFLVPK